MPTDTATLLKQFERIEEAYKFCTEHYANVLEEAERINYFCTLSMACIIRLTDTSSIYAQQANAAMKIRPTDIDLSLLNVNAVHGVITALKSDIEAGYLSKLRELIHADVFSDFLETAEYFLSEGHKDPAAVLIGGVLEEHLRQLCTKNGIDLQTTNAAGDVKPKMGDSLNADLYKVNVYGKPEQSQVIAWLALRNKAAHGKYTEYTKEQIELFLQGLRNLIARFPA